MTILFRTLGICLLGFAATGCQTLGVSSPNMWPFSGNAVQTSYITPKKRAQNINAIAAKAKGMTPEKQQEQIDLLAKQIQTEEDPLVREAIVKAASKFEVPMAMRIMTAGLEDKDPHVRRTCCTYLARRKDPSAISALHTVVQGDDNLDVRIAATKALGELGSRSAVPSIAIALHDSDPALKLVAMEAMKSASGEELGLDVGAWRQYAANFTSPSQGPTGTIQQVSSTEEAAIAEKPTEKPTSRF